MPEAAFGNHVRNPRHRTENDISDVVASRDLKRLCDLGVLMAIGAKRGRYYIGSERLLEIAARTHESGRAPDPYEVVSNRPRLANLHLRCKGTLERLTVFQQEPGLRA